MASLISTKKLTRDEGSVLEKAFWKINFNANYIKELDEFLITNFMMVTIFNDYVRDFEGFEKDFRNIMEYQFEHDLYNKFFSNQLESDETDSLQRRIE